jgi:cyanophycin synthetase
MRLQDCRRLTGPNLHLAEPGAIAEVTFAENEDRDAALARWRERATRALTALAWPVHLATRVHAHGADLVFAAPVDALYLAADVQEWAASPATDLETSSPSGRPSSPASTPPRAPPSSPPPPPATSRSSSTTTACRSATAAAPRPGSRDSCSRPRTPSTGRPSRRIPVALITGTNGKTTTARMLARIARAAGLVPGNTSTDGMTVGDRLIEEGDWTGPGAARIVLRHPEVDLAVLEVARGGILRRGLAVDRCGAAAVTNVSADHLGEYGVDDLATMARVKAVVGSVVDPHGRVVLGADSQPLVDLVAAGHHFPAPIAWFALAADHPSARRHRAARRRGLVHRRRPADPRPRRPPRADRPVADLPSAFGGAAEHNVLNALAAAALASALGLPDAAIVRGPARVHRQPRPRHPRALVGDVRCSSTSPTTPPASAASAASLASLRGDRRLLVGIGVAGDRRDDDIRDVARAVHELAPDRVLVRDLEHYLRGRAPARSPPSCAAPSSSSACPRIPSTRPATRSTC